VIATLTGHFDWVNCCSVFAEGRRALSGSADSTLKVWDLDTYTVIATLTGHSGTVSCCAVFAEGRRGLSGGWDGTLKVWNLDTNTVIATLTGRSGAVWCCSVSIACNDVFKEQNLQLVYSFLACGSSKQIPDNSGGGGAGVGAGAGSCPKRPKLIDSGTTPAVAGGCSKKGNITTIKEQGTVNGGAIQVYRSNNFRMVCRLSRVTRLIFAFARELDSDGRRAISGSDDGTFKVWDLESNAVIATIPSGHSEVRCCDVFGDGTPRVLTGGRGSDNTLKIWG
jgi:WD40 repeat protein